MSFGDFDFSSETEKAEYYAQQQRINAQTFLSKIANMTLLVPVEERNNKIEKQLEEGWKYSSYSFVSEETLSAKIKGHDRNSFYMKINIMKFNNQARQRVCIINKLIQDSILRSFYIHFYEN